MTQAEAYMVLAKFGISLATSRRSLRNMWVAEEARREKYGLSQAQIDELAQACRDQIAIVEEGEVPEEPKKQKKRAPPKRQRMLI
jgi:hypothetical protein